MNKNEIEEYMKERSLHCDRLAIECFKFLEKEIEHVATKLNNGLEIAKFLSGLENRIAISLSMKVRHNQQGKNINEQTT